MSTLKLDTLSNKAGTASVPSDTIVSGTAKAWVNFNGTGTVAIRRAFNVSSITDNGTGSYTVNLTNAMPDADYSCFGTAGDFSGGIITVPWRALAAPTTTSFHVASLSYTGTYRDEGQISVAIFR